MERPRLEQSNCYRHYYGIRLYCHLNIFFVIFITNSISIQDAFHKVFDYLDSEIGLRLWVAILLIFAYLILIFSPFTSFIIVLFRRITSTKVKGKEIPPPEIPPAFDHSTSLFHQRMSSAFPGTRGITWFNDPKIAIDRLEILLREPLIFKARNEFESDPIWWFRGLRAFYIGSFKRLSRKKALMNIDELKVKRIAAFHGDLYFRDFVYVELEAEKQTGLYNYLQEDIQRQIDSFGFSREEYGLIKNKFGWTTPISQEDYMDGATVRGGKVKDISNAEYRSRHLSKYNFIIAAKGSPYNSNKFQSDSDLYFSGILNNEISHESFFDHLKGYDKYQQ